MVSYVSYMHLTLFKAIGCVIGLIGPLFWKKQNKKKQKAAINEPKA